MPTIAIIQDVDDRPGFGAFWGEVQTAVHAALGVKGCVTNGSFRDIDMLAPGFQIVGGRIGPSHAHVHMTQMKCDVTIFGMLARHDDVIHADVHGAVVIPAGGRARFAQGDRPPDPAREGDPRPGAGSWLHEPRHARGAEPISRNPLIEPRRAARPLGANSHPVGDDQPLVPSSRMVCEARA